MLQTGYRGGAGNQQPKILDQIHATKEQRDQLRRLTDEEDRVVWQMRRELGDAAMKVLTPPQQEKAIDELDRQVFSAGEEGSGPAPDAATKPRAAATRAAPLTAAAAAVPVKRAAGAPGSDNQGEEQALREFPYTVKFEQGATRFLKGDDITILEIRGTAREFTAGNIYWIKGTYTLTSHDRATLAAFTTAKEAADGNSRFLKVQTAVVTRGHGTFTVFLPMGCRGWPHVSFYPADGGEVFGGNYFGTGDSVLKQWWTGKRRDETGPQR